MVIARFHSESGIDYNMYLHEDRVSALSPQELGIRIPFEYRQAEGEPGVLKWDLSYLYAELWMPQERGPRLLAPSLPEFSTQDSKPDCIRIPIPSQSARLMERTRRGGDVPLILHVQATMVGSVATDDVPDEGRRETLKSLGLARDTFGPIRRSDDVTIHIDRSVWAEEILPQWDLDDFDSIAPLLGAWQPPIEHSRHLDIQAIARSLHGTTPGGDLREILQQFRDPIVGL